MEFQCSVVSQTSFREEIVEGVAKYRLFSLVKGLTRLAKVRKVDYIVVKSFLSFGILLACEYSHPILLPVAGYVSRNVPAPGSDERRLHSQA